MGPMPVEEVLPILKRMVDALGYAHEFNKLIASSPSASNVSTQIQGQLTKSFSSATQAANQYPQYASQITTAAKQSFLHGADLAYAAGMIAVLTGAVIVFTMFPRHHDELELLQQFHDEDVAANK